MFVRPSRRAYAPLESSGKRKASDDVTHGLLVSEMNFYYRPGDGYRYAWRNKGRGRTDTHFGRRVPQT